MKKASRYFVSAIVIVILLLGSLAMAPAQSQFAAASQKYFVVQFAGPIQESWKDQVTAEGAEVLDYIPDFAFKVRIESCDCQSRWAEEFRQRSYPIPVGIQVWN